MTTRRGVVAACALMLFIGGCAQRKDLFVVLPNPDGSSGAVTIENGGQSILLDKPYAAGEIRGDKAQAVNITEEQATETFKDAIAAQPRVPARFELRFYSDSDLLKPESEALFVQVFDDIKRRPVYQVEVIGHTDTLGEKTYNQELSMTRAATIRDRLVKKGLNRDAITISGRGPLDLKIATADQVSEPLNRRVVIIVR